MLIDFAVCHRGGAGIDGPKLESGGFWLGRRFSQRCFAREVSLDEEERECDDADREHDIARHARPDQSLHHRTVHETSALRAA